MYQLDISPFLHDKLGMEAIVYYTINFATIFAAALPAVWICERMLSKDAPKPMFPICYLFCSSLMIYLEAYLFDIPFFRAGNLEETLKMSSIMYVSCLVIFILLYAHYKLKNKS